MNADKIIYSLGSGGGGGTVVEANPTLSGNEDALIGIEIGGTKYKVPNSTYVPFPAGWTTNLTTAQFCSSVNADASAVAGMAYLGELTCSDLPTGLSNVEAVVEVIDGTGTSNKVIHITITSGNVSPYRWEYTYWNNGSNVSGWIAFQTKVGVNPAQTTGTLAGLEIDGTNYAIQPVSMQATTTEPSSANTDGGYKLAILTSDPATKYAGYIYYITEA